MADSKREFVNVGVIGTGWWACVSHLPGIQQYDRARLTALADPNLEKLKAASRRFGPARTFSNHWDLIEAGGVDAVVVAVPHAFHYRIVKDALDANLHVLVEKPMTLTASEAWDLEGLARVKGLRLLTGYTYQYTRHAQSARSVIASGILGELLMVNALYAKPAEALYRGDRYATGPGILDAPAPDSGTYADPELAGGGQGQTQVTHALGMLLYVSGLRGSEVAAFMHHRGLPIDVLDAISFNTKQGAIGTMASSGAPVTGPSQKELRYYGSDGFMLQDMELGTLSVHLNSGHAERFTRLRKKERYPRTGPVEKLCDLILDGGENPAPPQAAAATVELIEAAYISAREGRIVRPELGDS